MDFLVLEIAVLLAAECPFMLIVLRAMTLVEKQRLFFSALERRRRSVATFTAVDGAGDEKSCNCQCVQGSQDFCEKEMSCRVSRWWRRMIVFSLGLMATFTWLCLLACLFPVHQGNADE